jgi:hypothetical protein
MISWFVLLLNIPFPSHEFKSNGKENPCAGKKTEEGQNWIFKEETKTVISSYNSVTRVSLKELPCRQT